jgi:type I restriction enzyme S subunit
MPAVDATEGAITKPQTRRFSEVRKGFTSFREDDVIMAKITPCMENGKAAIARHLINGQGFGSTEFHVFRSTGAVLPEFIYHFIRQDVYRRAAEAEMTGSVGQKRVPQSFLETTELPLPPLHEQIRIVRSLTELLMTVKASHEKLSRVPATLKRFRQAVLAAACSGRLTEEWRAEHPAIESGHTLAERIRQSHVSQGLGHGGQAAAPTEDVHNVTQDAIPDTWVVEELKVLCQPGRSITYGILKPGPDVSGGISYIRVADFPNNRLKLEGIRRTTKQIADMYRRSALREGDLLLSIRGTAGRVCRVPAQLDGANITQDTARISIHPELSSDYMEFYLRCPSTQKRLESAMKGVAVRGVNIGDVRVLQVALPPRAEQDEIVRRVDALLKIADAIDGHLLNATARADKLTESILAKAFRGELVFTEAELARREGREYEPASVLLERIKNGRNSGTILKAPRRQLRSKALLASAKGKA